MAVLSREICKMGNSDILYKDMVYSNGSIIVKNVPHQKHFPSVEEEQFVEYIIDGRTSLLLSAVVDYMLKNNLQIFDYKALDDYPEIEVELFNQYS